MLPTTGGDEEIRYTIALEGAAQAQVDIEKMTAGVKEFNTQLATAIQLVKQLMEQFSGKGGAAPQLPEFQKAFENQVQTQSNISLGVWEKAVQEIDKMNVGVATSSNLINTMTASLIAAEQADRQFEAGLARKTNTLAGFGNQITDTNTKIDQLAQKLGTGTPELKAPTPTEIVQPKVNPEVLQQAASGVEHLVKAETDLVEVNKKVEASTPKVISTPPVEEVKPVTIPVITADAGTAIDKLKTKEDELKASSQQLVQPLEQVDQASKKAQGGSENLTLGLSKLGEQTVLTKQGVQDLNKAIEAQPEKVTVAPEITTPAITNVPTQAVASLDALDQEQQKVKTSADNLSQAEVGASQSTQSLGQTAANTASGGIATFRDQVDQAKVAIQGLIDNSTAKNGLMPEVLAQFDVAKMKSPLDPAAWDQALKELSVYKGAAEEAAAATNTIPAPMTAAQRATQLFNDNVSNLLAQLQILAGQGKSINDFASVFGQAMNVKFTPDEIVEAFRQAKQAGIDFSATVSKGLQGNRAEIGLAKQALQELAAIKNISPLNAAKLPEFQSLNFNPDVVTGAMKDLENSFTKTAVKKDAFKVNLQTLWQAFKQGKTPIEGIQNAFSLLVKGFSTGGGILSAIIGGVFGFGLISIVRTAINTIGQLLQAFNQAAAGALEFLDATFKLEIGLRDAQRKGFDATRDELIQFSKDFKEKYPMFSNVAIRKGLADMIFFTKELGISSQDAFKMFDSSAALAIATGKDVGEVMRMIALAASSGYSEGLQRMGLNINKVTITERAHALGIKETYMQMKQEDRAAALLNLVLEQTAGITKDVAEKQKNLAGWAETVAAKQTDAANQLGKAWLPYKTFFDQIGVDFLTNLGKWLADVNLFVASVIGSFVGLGKLIEKILSGKAIGRNMADVIAESMQEGLAEAKLKMGVNEFTFDAVAQLKLELETVGLSEEQKQKVYESVDSFIENLEKSITDYQDSQVEAAEKYQEDLVKIEQDGLEKRAKLDEEYAQKQKDIEFKLHQDTEKAQLDLERSIADINLKANQDTQKAKEEAKQKELDLEKEYADKIAKLQRDLAFDLEEAVRSRDIAQIRRLQRQYGKDVTEAGIQKGQDKASIQHDLQQRLAEIQARRALDIQQRQIDFQQKMADLQAQAVLERQQALENYNKDLADLQKSLAQQRNERKKSYNDQLTDLHDAFVKRIKMASEALAKEVGMNAQAASQIAAYLIKLYGPNGVFTSVYDYMIKYINGGKDAILKNLGSFDLGLSKQASGGDYLVKKPTLFLAGEAGVEEAHFWPVNKPIQMPLTSGAGGVSEQYLRVMVDLGPDLVGKIVDKSIDKFADIIVENG